MEKIEHEIWAQLRNFESILALPSYHHTLTELIAIREENNQIMKHFYSVSEQNIQLKTKLSEQKAIQIDSQKGATK